MKKIALITASILALGATSVAADGTDATPGTGGADVIMASLSDISGAAIRRVRNLSIQIDSCEDAHWPYYLSDCLERV